MTIETSKEEKEYTARPMDQRQQRRRRGLNDRPKESIVTMETSADEDDHKDYNHNNGGIGGG